jgi:hypothetical protein
MIRPVGGNNTIEWDSLAIGELRSLSGAQVLPSQVHVSFTSRPENPPNRTTSGSSGLHAAAEPDRPSGCRSGSWRVQSVPSQVQVLFVLMLPSPENLTTSASLRYTEIEVTR